MMNPIAPVLSIFLVLQYDLCYVQCHFKNPYDINTGRLDHGSAVRKFYLQTGSAPFADKESALELFVDKIFRFICARRNCPHSRLTNINYSEFPMHLVELRKPMNVQATTKPVVKFKQLTANYKQPTRKQNIRWNAHLCVRRG